MAGAGAGEAEGAVHEARFAAEQVVPPFSEGVGGYQGVGGAVAVRARAPVFTHAHTPPPRR